jgi:uncharacterized membrane protein required for colicin V production
MQDLPPLSIVDIVALVAVLLGTLRGIRRGLSGEIAGLVSVVAGIILGLYFYQTVAEWTIEHTRVTGRPALVLAFVFTVATAMLAMVILRMGITNVIRLVVREDFDRWGGAVAGFLSTTIFVLMVFLIIHMLPEGTYLHRTFGADSAIGTLIAPYIPEVEDESDQDIDTILGTE